MLPDWFARFERGDRLALSRVLTWIDRGEHLGEISEFLARLPQHVARVVAFTGSGGVGKSTLVGKMIGIAVAAKQKVAVLACDPQSPLSGGALLGDRFRMGEGQGDAVFIRSLAAQAGQGALAENLDLMTLALERFGFDCIYIETVGAGQGDTRVRELANVVVLLLQPEAGDDLQWEKAGVLEVADIVVIHKSDLPGAEQTLVQVRASLELTHAKAPVILVSSKKGQGHQELWRAIEQVPLEDRTARTLPELGRRTLETLRHRVHGLVKHPDAETQTLLAAWQAKTLTTEAAVAKLVERLSVGG